VLCDEFCGQHGRGGTNRRWLVRLNGGASDSAELRRKENSFAVVLVKKIVNSVRNGAWSLAFHYLESLKTYGTY